ncbi:hypothetical protein SAMN04487905_11273 [Actinopolyspora xinjiangensis]|uniref:WXG100 family type VII secretion target n=1 Tax=Actinopolyspora xinjiangensis TaxID=405564 RepID=A0A1H0WH46_9ACTN|nr:DUF6571 family protein [Actinopolyspora xinjiangensis]SDP89893.1 hypothetical protein SAMN04487905_11273 [Actinopolyspora xinjiangensis]
MDYRQLMEAEPSAIARAAEAWKSLAEKYDKVLGDFDAKVRGPLDNEEAWQGEAKDAATGHAEHIREKMREYLDRIESVRGTLEEASSEIETCRARLERLSDEINEVEGWDIYPDGRIEYPEGQQARYESYAAEIDGVLARAEQADQNAASALGEADESLGYLDEVLREERGEEEAAAKRAAKLASQPPGELDFEEGERLARLLREHGQDPAFAGEFLERVRPKQLLKLTDHLQDMGMTHWDGHNGESGPNRSELIGQLQRHLGETLATGTSESGRRYLGEDLHGDGTDGEADNRAASYGKRLARAAENWDTGFLGMGDHEDTGYRALGMLLHSGEYSADFLNPVGDAMIDADRKDTFDRIQSNDLNHVDDRGRGGDPLVGLMTALEHSPEAASSFFDPERETGNMGYLIERDWPVDTYDHAPGPASDFTPTEKEKSLGHDVLGKALESATLGEQQGTAEGARVLSGLVHELANTEQSMENPGEGTVPEPMRDSVGRMISHHMAAVHDSGAVSPNSSGSLDLDGDDPKWAKGKTGDMSPRFSQAEVYKVMGSAAYDPDAYAEMRDANMVHTGLKLDEIAGDEDRSMGDRRDHMATVAKESASVFGALDEARTYAVDQANDDDDAEHNAKIDAGGTLASWALTGAGGAVGGAAGGIGGAVGGEAVNQIAEQLKQDSSNIVTRDTAAIKENGPNDASDLLNQALWENQMWKDGVYPPPISPGSEELENPNRIINSDGNMPRSMRDWVSEYNPYEVDQQVVQNTYQNGAGVYSDATGNRPVSVSDTE